MSAVNSSDIPISDIVRVVSRLADICASSVGPMCQKTLLKTSTGSIQFVSDGIDILNALQFSHPVARFVVNSLRHAHSVAGDGSKLFMLYTCELIRSVEQHINSVSQTNSPWFRHNIRDVSRGLTDFKRLMMEVTFRNRLYPDIFVVSSNFELICCHLKQMCKSVLLSSFPVKESLHLSTLLIDSFLSSGANSTDSFRRNIDFTIDHFDIVVHKHPGYSYTSSKVLSGILIPSEGSTPLGVSSSDMEQGILSVVLQTFLPFDDHAEATEATFTIPNMQEVNSLFSFQFHRCETFIKQCKLRNVELVFCCCEIPKYAETLFQQHGITTVAYLTEEFCEYFQTVTKKLPVSCILDSITESSLVTLILHDSTSVNNSNYLRVTLPLSNDLVNISASLILMAPTLGMAHSLAQQILKCLRCLRMCFETPQVQRLPFESCKNKHSSENSSKPVCDIFTIPATTFQTRMLQYCQDRAAAATVNATGNYYKEEENIPWKILENTFRCICRKVCKSEILGNKNYVVPGTEARKVTDYNDDDEEEGDKHSEEYYKEGSWLPLSTEFYMLHAATQVVTQLLDIDQIVKVKSKNEKSKFVLET